MKTTNLILLMIAMVAAGCRTTTIQSRAVGPDLVVIGELGQPIGTTIEVEAEIAQKSLPPEEREIFVTVVNGRKLASPTTIDAEPIPDLPVGTTVRLRGHERGTLYMLTADMTQLGPQAAKTFVPHQRLDSTFVIERVVEPDMRKK